MSNLRDFIIGNGEKIFGDSGKLTGIAIPDSIKES